MPVPSINPDLTLLLAIEVDWQADDWIVVNSVDSAYNVHDGDVFRWSDSFCYQMVRDRGPNDLGVLGVLLGPSQPNQFALVVDRIEVGTKDSSLAMLAGVATLTWNAVTKSTPSATI